MFVCWHWVSLKCFSGFSRFAFLSKADKTSNIFWYTVSRYPWSSKDQPIARLIKTRGSFGGAAQPHSSAKDQRGCRKRTEVTGLLYSYCFTTVAQLRWFTWSIFWFTWSRHGSQSSMQIAEVLPLRCAVEAGVTFLQPHVRPKSPGIRLDSRLSTSNRKTVFRRTFGSASSTIWPRT